MSSVAICGANILSTFIPFFSGPFPAIWWGLSVLVARRLFSFPPPLCVLCARILAPHSPPPLILQCFFFSEFEGSFFFYRSGEVEGPDFSFFMTPAGLCSGKSAGGGVAVWTLYPLVFPDFPFPRLVQEPSQAPPRFSRFSVLHGLSLFSPQIVNLFFPGHAGKPLLQT